MLNDIKRINSKWGLQNFEYMSDDDQFSTDYWQTPLELTFSKRGDCEDIAIAKYYDLKELGYTPWLVYCIDRRTHARHMICLLNGIVLDLDRIYDLNEREICPYEFVFGFNHEEYKIFHEFKPIGRDLGIWQLSKWTDLLERYENIQINKI